MSLASIHPSAAQAAPRTAPGALTAAFGALVRTEADWAQSVLRLTLAVVFFPHGAQKLLGWFGGYGFEGTMGYFTGTLGLPAIIALLVILFESFGSVALLLGLFSRVAALGIASVMVGAIWITHAANGFFMNWAGSQAGEGLEYHLLAIGLALAVIIRGSGAASLDRLLARRRV